MHQWSAAALYEAGRCFQETGNPVEARKQYRQVRREALGTGWTTDYPDADRNLMLRLSQLTKTPIRTNSRGRPEHLVVQFTDEELFQCPFIFMSDVGTIGLNSEEAEHLRNYLERGGLSPGGGQKMSRHQVRSGDVAEALSH